MFKNYIKELIGTITVSVQPCVWQLKPCDLQASPRSLSCIASSVPSCTSKDGLSDDQSDCSSELSVQASQVTSQVTSPKTSNTLLAMATTPSPDKSFSIDRETSDPDLLWRRTPQDKIGKINSLGRYEPGWELGPSMNRNDGTKKTSRISKAVKKLVNNEDHEKMKEEMAWQVAEMFVKEVTSVTLSPGPGPGPAIAQSASADYSLADISLDLDNLELPAAKYF